MNYHAINHEYKEKHISELKTFPSAKDETSLTYFQTIFDLLLLKNSQPKILHCNFGIGLLANLAIILKADSISTNHDNLSH